MKHSRNLLLLASMILGSAVAAGPLLAQGGHAIGTPLPSRKVPKSPYTVRASVDSQESQANNYSQNPRLSASGRVVVFTSNASNLVAGDTNNAGDVFLRDRKLGSTERVSLTHTGAQADGWSGEPVLTPDGRYLAFTSLATNLTADPDTNGKQDVFLRDLQTGAVERISRAWDEAEPNGMNYGIALSPDGRFVAWSSEATNLVPGDTNLKTDVFLRDRQSGTIELVSRAGDGSIGDGRSYFPSVSEDGRYLSFSSDSTNLLPVQWNPYYQVFVRDRQLGTTELVSVTTLGLPPLQPTGSYSRMTPDGRFVVFASYSGELVPADENGAADVFVRDRLSGTTVLVSLSTDGQQGNADSLDPMISDDGRFVSFQSIADNLWPDDDNLCSDGFVRDRWTGRTWCVSVTPDQHVGNDFSWPPVLAAGGWAVAFSSHARDLVADDTNQTEDVFVRAIR